MKWSKPKNEPYSLSYRITARKNGFKAIVVYNDHYKTYYFLTEKNGIMYNSCWDRKEYRTEENCKLACEQWIDERTMGKTIDTKKEYSKEYSKEFQSNLLDLFEMCYENHTDSCTLTFEYPNAVMEIDFTFRAKKRVEDGNVD